MERSRGSPLVVAAGVRPLKPGVSPEQAQAALAPFYRSRLEMEVKEPAFANVPERGRKRFLDNKLSIVPAAQGRSGLPRVDDDAAVGADGNGGRRIAHCLRERRQPAARTRRASKREMAVRLALGATRGGLVRQLLIESLVLAAAGGLVGIFLSVVGAPLVLSFFVNPETPQPISTAPDLRILGFTFAVSALTGILFGLAPALRSTKPTLAPTLKHAQRSRRRSGSDPEGARCHTGRPLAAAAHRRRSLHSHAGQPAR